MTKVAIYKNLHKSMFSVVSREGENYGKVIAHCDGAVLSNVTFTVSQAGRNRVLNERKKNVHAYVVGHIEAAKNWQPFREGVDFVNQMDNESTMFAEKICYNPYQRGSFFYHGMSGPVDASKASVARLDVSDGVFAWDVE